MSCKGAILSEVRGEASMGDVDKTAEGNHRERRSEMIVVPSPADGKRRRFSVEQKLFLVKEYDAAPLKYKVLFRYGITYSYIFRWRNEIKHERHLSK